METGTAYQKGKILQSDLPVSYIYLKGNAGFTAGVQDIYMTRRQNLRAVIKSRFGGSQTKFGELVDYDSSRVSRLLSENPATQKNIGARLARSIEQKLDLPQNWLDAPHAGPTLVEQQRAHYSDSTLNLDVLAKSISLVETYLDARDEALKPRDKAIVLAYVYDHYLVEGKADDRVVARVLKLRIAA
jgi:hypothetical protein